MKVSISKTPAKQEVKNCLIADIEKNYTKNYFNDVFQIWVDFEDMIFNVSAQKETGERENNSDDILNPKNSDSVEEQLVKFIAKLRTTNEALKNKVQNAVYNTCQCK